MPKKRAKKVTRTKNRTYLKSGAKKVCKCRVVKTAKRR